MSLDPPVLAEELLEKGLLEDGGCDPGPVAGGGGGAACVCCSTLLPASVEEGGGAADAEGFFAVPRIDGASGHDIVKALCHITTLCSHTQVTCVE